MKGHLRAPALTKLGLALAYAYLDTGSRQRQVAPSDMCAISILATSGSVGFARQFTISAGGEGRAQPSSLRLIG